MEKQKTKEKRVPRPFFGRYLERFFQPNLERAPHGEWDCFSKSSLSCVKFFPLPKKKAEKTLQKNQKNEKKNSCSPSLFSLALW